MCNLANERKRINELLILAVNSDAVRSCADATQLMEVSHAALREHYQDKCPTNASANAVRSSHRASHYHVSAQRK